MQTSDADNFFRAESALADEEARKLKAVRTKEVGEPIDLESKITQLVIRGNDAWTTESGWIARRINLDTGNTMQIYKGHAGPVTCLALYDAKKADESNEMVLITGSWDKTIRIWNTKTKAVISETVAHGDFVKYLLVIPSIQMLVSSSSDKIVKLWDLSDILSSDSNGKPLHQLASISGHTRPVESLAYMDSTFISLFTGDSMGVIKVWDLDERWSAAPDSPPTVKVTYRQDLGGHRTGVNDMWIGKGYLLTASTDNTATIRSYSDTPNASNTSSIIHTIQHPDAVKRILPLPLIPGLSTRGILVTACGDVLRTYDVSEMIDIQDEDDPLEESRGAKRDAGMPKAHLLSEVDAHYFTISALAVWFKAHTECYIVSASLDGTLRRWKLFDLLENKIIIPKEVKETSAKQSDDKFVALTEEEERELAELMDDDD